MSKKSNVIVTEILAACEIVMVPVKSLVKSAYNCRHIPLSSAEIEELAENIAAVGLLQNIVIHKVKGSKSKYGVAAGENRRLAFNVLVSQNRISPDYLVPAHVVDEAKALIVSYAENNNRKAMHPADQIVLFKTLRDQEKDASQIAASFGYTTRHVNRMLKLTDMAPALLQSLAENKINVDQLQALSICDSHERQVEIWEGAQHYMNGDTPSSLKRSASRDEVCIKDNKLVKFIGLADYESAGGHIKRDLFSSDDDGFISDPSILERIAIEKLDQIASGIQESEGWSWALARIDQVYHYGTYGSDNEFRIMNDPDAVFSENQSNRISELNGKIEQLNEYLENFDSEEDKYKQFENAIIAMENEQVAIEAQAVISSWPDDEKHSAGIVVSLCPSGVVVQRGIRLINTKADTSMENSSENSSHNLNADSEECEEPKSYSAALVASLTSERTIAVQAELSKQPKVAMALLG